MHSQQNLTTLKALLLVALSTVFVLVLGGRDLVGDTLGLPGPLDDICLEELSEAERDPSTDPRGDGSTGDDELGPAPSRISALEAPVAIERFPQASSPVLSLSTVTVRARGPPLS